MKNFLLQILASLVAIPIWELFILLFKKSLHYNKMEHAGILNLWFIIFFISVNLLFFSLSRVVRKKKKQRVLDRLENLTDDPCFKPNVCFNKDACVGWANNVEVLLKGTSTQYNEWVVHRTTMLQTHNMFDGMGYLISRMRNILDLAIKEMKEEIKNKKIT